MESRTENLISQIIQSLNQKIEGVDPIVGHGSVNQIFIVTTDTEKLVIRLNDNRGFDEFVKENWCIEQAAAIGVPGPKVLKLGELDGHSYMVQSFLEGMVASQGKIDSTAVWREVGRYAKKIHSIPVSGFGLGSAELMESDLNTSDEKWKKFVSYNIDSLTQEDKLLELGVLDSGQSAKVKQLFEQLINQKFDFGLNHGDLSLKNVMVSPKNEVSIFDWGSAEAQIVPHHDFGEILKSSIKENSAEFKAFLEGYDMSEEKFGEIVEDVHTIMLLRSIDKLRWAIDRSPTDVEDSIGRVKEIYQLKFN